MPLLEYILGIVKLCMILFNLAKKCLGNSLVKKINLFVINLIKTKGYELFKKIKSLPQYSPDIENKSRKVFVHANLVISVLLGIIGVYAAFRIAFAYGDTLNEQQQLTLLQHSAAIAWLIVCAFFARINFAKASWINYYIKNPNLKSDM